MIDGAHSLRYIHNALYINVCLGDFFFVRSSLHLPSLCGMGIRVYDAIDMHNINFVFPFGFVIRFLRFSCVLCVVAARVQTQLEWTWKPTQKYNHKHAYTVTQTHTRATTMRRKSLGFGSTLCKQKHYSKHVEVDHKKCRGRNDGKRNERVLRFCIVCAVARDFAASNLVRLVFERMLRFWCRFVFFFFFFWFRLFCYCAVQYVLLSGTRQSRDHLTVWFCE